MKNYIKLGLLIFISILFLGDMKVNAQALKISVPSAAIFVKQKITLKITPRLLKNKVNWKSENKKVAK